MSLYDMLVHYFGTLIGLLIMIVMYNLFFNVKRLNLKDLIIISIVSIISTVNTIYNYTFSKIIIFYLLYISTLWLIYRKNIKSIFISGLFIYLIVLFVETVFGIFMYYLPFNNVVDVNNSPLFKFIISCFISIISFLIVKISIINKYLLKCINFLKEKDLIMIGIVIVLTILAMSSITFKNALNYKSITLLVINVLTFICLIVILIISLYNFIMRKKAESKENILLDFIKEYEFLIDKDRINRHEMLNNLLVIKSFKNRNSKDFENLIDEFINNYKLAGSKIASNLYNLPSGLKGMIYYKIYDMEKENIKVETNISNKVVSKLDRLDAKTYTKICKIIGILLDNAIEGTNSANKKEISIVMDKENDKARIVISNTTNTTKININKINEKNYSSKGKNRGYGLYLVNKMVSTSDNLIINQEILKDKFKTTLLIK